MGFARRFVRQEDGAAAVEFALVAVPFLALLFAIIETALVFFASQSLEAGVSAAARQVMTGQAQDANYTQEEFKTKVVCEYFKNGIRMFDCENGILVSVRTFTDFSSADTSAPLKDGKLTVDPKKLPFDTGVPGSIVVVQLYYRWPVYLSLLSLANVGTDRLLVATSVFKNEPYD